MTPPGLLYSDYHARVINTLHEVLTEHGIGYDLMHIHGNIDPDSDRLLVVWSHDSLSSRETAELGKQQTLQQIMDQLCALDRPVIWLTDIDQAHLDFDITGTNLCFLHYGGWMMCEMAYRLMAPQREKMLDPDSMGRWVSLSRGAPTHRILAACCLLGQGLGDQTSPENRGLLRISNYPVAQYQSLAQYVRDSTTVDIAWNPDQEEILHSGLHKLQQGMNGGQPASNIYEFIGINNAANFDRSMRLLYQHSMIEILNEVTFFSKGIFVTEKFLNSVYGFNLPIVLANPGYVSYLRGHGFNMFDDVIDHDYDHIADPVDRIFAAVQSNRRLLTDFDYARRCYQHCLPALEQNYQYATQGMYDHFLDHFRQNLKAYLKTN